MDPARGVVLWAGRVLPDGAAVAWETIVLALHDRGRPGPGAMLSTDVPRPRAALRAVMGREQEGRATGLELARASYALNTVVTEVPGRGPRAPGGGRRQGRVAEIAPGCAAVRSLAAQAAASEGEATAALCHLQLAHRLDPAGPWCGSAA